ncbi:MAG: hypothetical protein J6R52_02130, partial [Alphaproteobacteria bacterium]|nr:hypothetical protein [Alphaproteobacteria bacterium]
MPLEARKFIFTVSLCAMLAANPVLATAPTNDEDLGTTHDVYVESTLNQATNGIAGVSYVNRMVNAAGNAADAAEAHAAAAGAHALSAAQSADEAHKVLADKVNIDQGASNKAMVTDDKGTVYPGYITNDMIDDNAVTADKIKRGEEATVLLVQLTGLHARTAWGKIDSGHISDGAVTTDKIAEGAVTADKLDLHHEVKAGMPLVIEWKNNTTGMTYGAGTILPSGIVSADENGMALVSQKHVDSSGRASYVTEWGQISSVGIANGAVTIDKTAGVVGMVPEGSPDATTYSQMWIE